MNESQNKSKAVPKLGYSLREAFEATSLSRRKLEYLIQQGTIRAVKIGRRIVIPSRELERLLEKGAGTQ
jgi:excisionase family DNA binding protein